MLLALSGAAGTGKDLVAEMISPRHLVRMGGTWVDVRGLTAAQDPRRALRQRAVQVALADPLKAFAGVVYDWPLETLWGPSGRRNHADMRYPLPLAVGAEANTHAGFLTPRRALQTLGTEWGRAMNEDTWVRLMVRTAEELLADKRTVSAGQGRHVFEIVDLVVVSDVRFANEAKAITEAGGEVWVIERPNAAAEGRVGGTEPWRQHASEQSFAGVREYATHTLLNDGSIEQLRERVAAALVERGV